MSKVYDWFEERLEVQAIADDISSKYVPPHVNIFYCFGGLVFTCFLIQVATGFAMTFYYRPSVVDAFASVEYIMTSVNFGWLIRSIHRWSASMMVLMLVLHVFRVYLTGGFKKPRELTWVTGVILSVVTVSFGVTGYSLPWDQVGFWACKIVTGVPAAGPVVGRSIAFFKCFVNGWMRAMEGRSWNRSNCAPWHHGCKLRLHSPRLLGFLFSETAI